MFFNQVYSQANTCESFKYVEYIYHWLRSTV